MKFVVDVNDEGGLAVGAHLKRIGTRAGNLRGVADRAHDLLMRAIDYQYGRGGPAVGGWKPNTPRWTAYKARNGFDVRVMHMTGRLRASLTDKGHPEHVWRVTTSGFLLSTAVPYAGYLLDGGRPPVIVSQTATGRAADLIRQWLIVETAGD